MAPPSGVCFRALVNRLLRIFSSLSRSTRLMNGSSSPSYRIEMSRKLALSSKLPRIREISWVTSCSPTHRRRTSISNWLKSSIWSISRSIELALAEMESSFLWASAGTDLSFSREESGPEMMVSGLRNSWAMLAKKLMFISLARCSSSVFCSATLRRSLSDFKRTMKRISWFTASRAARM